MPNDFLIPIGRRIAQIRRANGLSQESLADRLGVSPKHVSHTECGTSSLSLKNLIEFCRIFDCSLDYLIFGKEENPALTILPDEITSILYSGSAAEKDRLVRYLQMYLELTGERTAEEEN